MVGEVAIASYRGDRRVVFFQRTLYNKAGDEVAKLESLESGGQTEDFEEFEFDEAVKGSKTCIDVRGTTAGLWNGIAEVPTCLL